MQKNKILFDVSKLKKEELDSIGVYKITNKITNDFYIGSTDRKFKTRFQEHFNTYYKYKEGGKFTHPKLWSAYDKYGIENFQLEILEILDGKTDKDILEREEYYIQILKPKYNICQFPTEGGKPNFGKKLSKEWKAKISEKSAKYKHSCETLAIITQNNRSNAIRLRFTNISTNKELNFKSWVEAQEYFKMNSNSGMKNSFKQYGQWHGWKIEKLTSQKKKIKVFLENEEKIFNSYSECDKYFNMWRGYTSTLINKKVKQLIKNKYDYELI